jgi:hypothetical protein
MVDRACQILADSGMILHAHLNLAAILGLGLYLRGVSTNSLLRNMGMLKVKVPDTEDSNKNSAVFNFLDMSLQHFIILPSHLATTPLALFAPALQSYKQFHLRPRQYELRESNDEIIIKYEIWESNKSNDEREKEVDGDTEKVEAEKNQMGNGKDKNKEKGKYNEKVTSDEGGSHKENSIGDQKNDAPLPELLALPEETDEELAFLNGVDLDQINDDSPSRLERMKMKRENGEENKFIDQLMAMQYLENVKRHFLKTKFIETLRRQGVDITTESFNAIFVGCPRVCDCSTLDLQEKCSKFH